MRERLQAQRRCAEYEADHREQERAATELRDTLAEFVRGPQANAPRSCTGDGSWESLESRVAGLNVQRLDGRNTPRSSVRRSTSLRRSQHLTPRTYARASAGGSAGGAVGQDPLGRISEMVARVARDRYNKCVLFRMISHTCARLAERLCAAAAPSTQQ